MIGERLKELRISNGLSREELAKTIGVSKNHIANIENNKTQPNIIVIVKLAKIFNVKANYILGLEK